MKTELDTLFLPFQDGLIDVPSDKGQILFMNGRYHKFLESFKGFELAVEQVFKPYAAALEQNGIECVIEADVARKCDFALVLSSKNQRESENMLAKGVSALKNGGWLVMAADNKTGGSRLKKTLQKLGFDNIFEQSKNKARVVWAQRPDVINDAVLKQWLSLDAPKEITGGFQSRLGLYGWDKIDKGSSLLAEYLPRDIKGRGADFGCGYGYLSKEALEKNRKIKALDYIDADARALPLCEANIEKFDIKKNGFWLDLTKPQKDLESKYDFILMNPPFHEGKRADSDIGVKFIETAYKSLCRKGALYVVANSHLPYESILAHHFWRVEPLFDAGGFKGFCAVK